MLQPSARIINLEGRVFEAKPETPSNSKEMLVFLQGATFAIGGPCRTRQMVQTAYFSIGIIHFALMLLAVANFRACKIGLRRDKTIYSGQKIVDFSAVLRKLSR